MKTQLNKRNQISLDMAKIIKFYYNRLVEGATKRAPYEDAIFLLLYILTETTNRVVRVFTIY